MKNEREIERLYSDRPQMTLLTEYFLFVWVSNGVEISFAKENDLNDRIHQYVCLFAYHSFFFVSLPVSFFYYFILNVFFLAHDFLALWNCCCYCFCHIKIAVSWRRLLFMIARSAYLLFENNGTERIEKWSRWWEREKMETRIMRNN